ncbi:hypothetical protein [Mycoplasmopsis cynos]|uniref:Uncharacterized protein n=1 Tax=Mycoplasmopsis cynos TaxID=171284 RepID=A0A449AHF0_9BACT|nr:hypothetical protein [Mycoplasmopsis cynos]VEU64423.1 Uncharacterised protein [Mycoplasmopsis cynos]
MTHLKLPALNQLGLNIKKICWKYNSTNYKQFRALIINDFNIKIDLWMQKNNIDLNLKKEYEQVLLYWTFINYKKEKQLTETLLNNGFNWAQPTNAFVDTVYKIDLLAKKDNIVYAIQVKPSKTNTNNFNYKTFLNACNKLNLVPLLAFKEHNKWTMINFKNGEIIWKQN